ncbi:MAG: PepSY domain-containing protein [Bacteroidales bacterium]|nr:PepSY domain-containing protein [Bacteroidales bacterium]MCD8395243.1 PepSY domain-containing protein [Bacteroidales bacterium]
MRRLFSRLHLWLSVPVGLIVTITCFSGAMLVFEDEIKGLSNANLYKVEAMCEKPLPIDALLETAASALPDSVKVRGVTIPSDPRLAYKVNLSNPRHGVLFIDQYTGIVKGQESRAGFFRTMFKLHRWLLDENVRNGKMIVGISTLVLVLILLTGIVVWIPKNRKGLRSRLKMNFTKGWHRLWLDLHVAGGFYASAILLILALTGLTWSFEWYGTAFYRLFGAAEETTTGNHHRGRKEDAPTIPPSYMLWQKVYDELEPQCKEGIETTIKDGSVEIQLDRLGNRMASDTYSFDTRTGELTGYVPYAEADHETQVWGWVYSLHVGSWGGLITKILTFLAALLGATLPLTGYYLWFRRIHSKKRNVRELKARKCYRPT